MYNENETTKQNKIKLMGLSILLLLMTIAFFFKKGSTTIMGLPIDKIENNEQ